MSCFLLHSQSRSILKNLKIHLEIIVLKDFSLTYQSSKIISTKRTYILGDFLKIILLIIKIKISIIFSLSSFQTIISGEFETDVLLIKIDILKVTSLTY